MNCQLVTVNQKVPSCVPHLGWRIMIATHSVKILWPFLKRNFHHDGPRAKGYIPQNNLVFMWLSWGASVHFRISPFYLMPDPYSTLFSGTGEAPLIPNWWHWATLASSVVGFHVTYCCQLLLLDVVLVEPDPGCPTILPTGRVQAGSRHGCGEAAGEASQHGSTHHAPTHCATLVTAVCGMSRTAPAPGCLSHHPHKRCSRRQSWAGCCMLQAALLRRCWQDELGGWIDVAMILWQTEAPRTEIKG